jgi:DUF4097 and DUF4098 domain-containing protein YvlB
MSSRQTPLFFVLGFLLWAGIPQGIQVARATEFQDSIVREFPLRSLGDLRITNARGDIYIDGWAQDRVRIQALRKAHAASLDEAKKIFAYTDIKYKNVDSEIEVSAEYGRGLSIEERLKERRSPKVSMDLHVLAPANLSLHVWAVSGHVVVKGWDTHLEVRSTEGVVDIDSIHKGDVAVLCPSCTLHVRNVHASVRCMGGSGGIEVSNVSGPHVYVESDGGSVNLSKIDGKQLYVSKSGSIQGTQLKGRIEFHTRQGNVSISDSSGFISGRTESGAVSAEMNHWFFADKALIESVTGNVSLILPPSFSGEVDLRSGSGHVSSAFSLILPPNSEGEGLLREKASRRPFSRLMGVVNDGGEELKLASGSGNVSLLKLPSPVFR